MGDHAPAVANVSAQAVRRCAGTFVNSVVPIRIVPVKRRTVNAGSALSVGMMLIVQAMSRTAKVDRANVNQMLNAGTLGGH